MSQPEFKFDKTIINLVEGLGHPYRYLILETLINIKTVDGLTMKEIQEETGLNVSTLHTHLNHLNAHNLITKTGTENTLNYYKMSELGTKFVNLLSSNE